MGTTSPYRVDHRRRDGRLESRVYLLAVTDDRTARQLLLRSVSARWRLKLGERCELVREDADGEDAWIAWYGLTDEGRRVSEGLRMQRAHRRAAHAVTVFARRWGPALLPLVSLALAAGVAWSVGGPWGVVLVGVAVGQMLAAIYGIWTRRLPRLPPPEDPRDHIKEEWAARIAADAILQNSPSEQLFEEFRRYLEASVRNGASFDIDELRPEIALAVERGFSFFARVRWLCHQAEAGSGNGAKAGVVRTEARLRQLLCIDADDLRAPDGVLLDRIWTESREEHHQYCLAAKWCTVPGCRRPTQGVYCSQCAELGTVSDSA
ncbi:hypothetical protein [Glycomyces sp. MUSA5-2]|uniref:hypothetical protein n=1 Tax=Glycomyces sp. MUSA5-2 TaxID=2053002 RepID=UPI00300817E9